MNSLPENQCPASQTSSQTFGSGRVVILDRDGSNREFYKARFHRTAFDFEFVEELNDRWEPPPQTDLVVTHQQYFLPEAAILARLIRDSQVPVLILADGILEHRNTWEHPQLTPGAIFQPVLGHKIACIGRSQARVLESWGNLGRCEIVGIPAFDQYLGRVPRTRPADEPFQLLIMTARTPAFNEAQMLRVEQSLADLKQWLHDHPTIKGIRVQPRWRVTKDLDQRLGIANELRSTSGEELAQALAQVDGMITTPSTAMLEGMLQGIPVATLDYHNCPAYVPAAWSITARSHLEQILPEMICPSASRQLYQDTILHDSLECRTASSPRLTQLVQEMIRLGREARHHGRPVQLPERILIDEQNGHHWPELRYDLQGLFPDHPVFANMDRAALQVELAHYRQALAELQAASHSSFPKRRFWNRQGPFGAMLRQIRRWQPASHAKRSSAQSTAFTTSTDPAIPPSWHTGRSQDET